MVTKSYTRGQLRRRKLIQQRLMGLAMVAISIFIVVMACHAKTPEDSDCTAVFLTAPLGLYMLFSRKVIIV